MSEKIKFSELVKALAESNNITQQKAEALVRGTFNLLLDDLEENGKASITSFGSFELKEVAERTGINPQTGDEIVIPAHNKVSFKPFKALEKTVNAPFSHLESTLIEESESESKPVIPKPKTDTVKEEEIEESEKDEDPFESVINADAEDESSDLDSEMEEDEEKEEAEIPPPVYKARESERNNAGALWVVVILLIAVVGVGGWYFFLRDSGDSSYENQVAEKESPKTEESAETASANTERPEEEADKVQPIPAEVVPDDEASKEKPAVTANSESSTAKEKAKPINKGNSPKEMTTYIIEKDEWLWDISREVYGKAYLWPLIFESNKKVGDNPNLVEPAKTLLIPSLEGNASALTKGDYAQLAKASRMVSEAYGNAGNSERAAEYLRFSKKYERHSKQ
jgi:DNA-binding protein HU-beta